MVTLYHNPRCSKSRAAKALLEDRGVELELIEYLKTPPRVEDLEALAAKLGVPARGMLRSNEVIFKELGLGDESLGEDALLSAIAEHPILLQRPIAVKGDRAVIGRPPERVLEL